MKPKRSNIDWSKPVKRIAAELGISLSRAYALRDSFRKPKPDLSNLDGLARAEAELRWILDTLNRCYRVEEAAQRDLGDALRRWRRLSGLKQVALSGKLFGTVNRSTDLCGVENGRIDASRGLVEALTRHLEAKQTELIP